MAKASANVFPYVHLAPAAAPASPAAGSQRLYLDSADGNKLKRKDSAGTVTAIEGSGGSTFVGCKVHSAAAFNFASGGGAVSWDTEDWDSDAFHSTVTNTDRLTVPTGQDGKYAISVNLGLGVAASVRFLFAVNKNGSPIPNGGSFDNYSTDGTNFQPAGSLYTEQALSAGDYITANYYITATKAANLANCSFSIRKIG